MINLQSSSPSRETRIMTVTKRSYFITSAKKVMFSPVSVCLFVYLSEPICIKLGGGLTCGPGPNPLNFRADTGLFYPLPQRYKTGLFSRFSPVSQEITF